MTIKPYLTILVCLAFLSACGGGGSKLSDSTKSAALSACEPPSGPAGTKVVCEVKGMTEDSTLFFDKKPVEYNLNAEEGTVSITVPAALSGEKNIFFQEGDKGVQPIGTFEVTSGTAPDGDDVEPAGDTTGEAPTGDGGEVINPSSPGGTTGGTTGGASETPPDSDGDGVPDTSDACAGTVAGTTVGSNGCPPTPPPPSGTQISEFTVEPAKKTDNAAGTDPRFSTYKIHWSFTNAKTAYVWGNIFNRESADSALPAADQCKLVGTAPSNRYLVTAHDGRSINPNLDENAATGNIKKKYKNYLQGALCDDSQAGRECKYGTYTQGPRDFPAYADARDPLLAKDLYFIQMELKKDYLEKLEKKDIGVLQIDPGLLQQQEANPKCRIDLNHADGTISSVDTIFTRSLVRNGTVCLAVQGNDDAWTVQCKSVKAPDATISDMSVKSATKPRYFSVSFDFSNVMASPVVAGCQNTGSSFDAVKGSGNYLGECEIKKMETVLDLTATGIGGADFNQAKETYTIKMGKPTATMNRSGGASSNCLGDCPAGEVKLHYNAETPFELWHGDEKVATPEATVPWANGLEFYGRYKVDGNEQTHITFRKVGTKDGEVAAEGTVTGYRDYTNTFWSFAAFDFDGLPSGLSNVVREDYESAFEISAFDGDLEAFPLPTVKLSVRWTGKNLKSIAASCEGQGVISSSVSKNWNVAADKTEGDFSMEFPWASRVVCDITATTVTNETITKHKTWN